MNISMSWGFIIDYLLTNVYDKDLAWRLRIFYAMKSAASVCFTEHYSEIQLIVQLSDP